MNDSTPKTAPPAPGNEKAKLIIMGVALVFVVIAYAAARRQEAKHREAEGGQLTSAEAITTERVSLPPFDTAEVEAIKAEVHDGTPREQLVIEPDALNTLQDYARLLRDPHFIALGTTVIDAAELREITSSPADHRARAKRVRGTVLRTLGRQRTGGRPAETIGLLDVEGGVGPVHFIAVNVPADLVKGDFVRLDGLFMKILRSEEPGGWVSAPLLIGNAMVPSFREIEAPDNLALALANVEDDTVQHMTGINSRARWELLAYARDLDTDAVDWDAAPELTNEYMAELIVTPGPHRGEAVRLPISTTMDSWTYAADENPLRLDKLTTGWIGNWNWPSQANVLRFFAPFSAPELSSARYVTGRGFFFKVHAYEPRDGGIRTAPVFVMTSIAPFIPPDDTRMDKVMLLVAGVTLTLGGMIVFLLSRDRKHSKRLRQELVARRRARRQQA
ncbi:MAG: hypothetical protein QF724_05410 [Planctomycetota bacterium]|jgi:hypothetical protein|nr:hypothetical protein [Planctomycetota bacterium]MDP6369788.1 hypothetical protein [Planctomycetota bacterium]MDP6519256.1 hypothetical protein [Planctomycetota bacterium]MDP6838357.1 hypothetical protein [Planctomycetota bacterium]MDP6955023.1 hypothetical protein [Planctomycetota bacterium]